MSKFHAVRSKSHVVPKLFTDWWTGRQTVDASELVRSKEVQAVLVQLSEMENEGRQRQQARRPQVEASSKGNPSRHTSGAE